MTYTARYAHSDSDDAGVLSLDATTDAQAVAEVRRFVESGYRNQTWACVELQDGRSYCVRNQHGKALGSYA